MNRHRHYLSITATALKWQKKTNRRKIDGLITMYAEHTETQQFMKKKVLERLFQRR